MFISAYYFRAHMYTIVPSQVRQDMQRMAEAGTNAVCIGMLDQDFDAAAENIDIIAEQANQAGMQLLVTPSRWGTLVAGCPKVPCKFTVSHPEVWVRNPDGSPRIGWLGPTASVHHPATFDYFRQRVEQLLTRWPVAGLVWDEIKVLGQRDYSPQARNALAGRNLDDSTVHDRAVAQFFDRVNAHALAVKPDVRLSMFVYGHIPPADWTDFAGITNLHEFGCDGRPYALTDGGQSDSDTSPAVKCLVDQAPGYIALAKANNKRSLLLIENHAMPDKDVALMDRRLPEILAMQPDHLLYYYYPRSLPNPDLNMNTIARHLKTIRS